MADRVGDDGLLTRTDLEVAASILDDHSRCVTLGPTARNLAVRMSTRLRAALAQPAPPADDAGGLRAALAGGNYLQVYDHRQSRWLSEEEAVAALAQPGGGHIIHPDIRARWDAEDA